MLKTIKRYRWQVKTTIKNEIKCDYHFINNFINSNDNYQEKIVRTKKLE